MRLVWPIFDLILSNSWLVWKHQLGDVHRHWRTERLFRFKLEIARCLLHATSKKPGARSSKVDYSKVESDDENEENLLPKKKF